MNFISYLGWKLSGGSVLDDLIKRLMSGVKLDKVEMETVNRLAEIENQLLGGV